MHVKVDYKLTFQSFGRSFGDFAETVNLATSRTWADAVNGLAERIYSSDSQEVCVSVDWRPVTEHIQFWNEIEIDNPEEMKTRQTEIEIHLQPVIVNARVEADLRKIQDSVMHSYLDARLEHFLHEVFLITNLACPGSFNFNRLNITGKDNDDFGVRLSSYYFEVAWLEALEQGWPTIEAINLDQVKQWYFRTEMPSRLVAQSRIGTALLSMLHLSAQKDLAPTTLIWLAHALEALCETRVGESFSTLNRRLAMVLNLTSNQAQQAKKRLREFYDLRSALVHGGLRIAHPMLDENIDPDLGAYVHQITRTTDIAAIMLLGTLQTMICHNWTSLTFPETVSGQ